MFYHVKGKQLPRKKHYVEFDQKVFSYMLDFKQQIFTG